MVKPVSSRPTPSTPKKPEGVYSRSMPLLFMAGLLIFMGVGLQVLRHTVWEDAAPKVLIGGKEVVKEEEVSAAPVTPAPAGKEEDKSSNVFDNLASKYPGYAAPEDQVAKPVKKVVPFFAHNPVWGNVDAPVELVVFVDNDCDDCRARFADVMKSLRSYERDMRVVMKFAPKQEREVSAGLFEQMARREGVHGAFLTVLLKTPYVSSETYLLLLEDAGVPLDRQREMMKDDLRSISRDIQLDINQFKALEGSVENESGLVMYLNGYRIGESGLDADHVAMYVSRLIHGQDLF